MLWPHIIGQSAQRTNQRAVQLPTGDGSVSVSLANSSSSSATLLSAARSEISGQGNEAQAEVNGHGMVLIQHTIIIRM